MKDTTDETPFRSFRHHLILVTAFVVTSSMMTFPLGAQAEPGGLKDMMSPEERQKSGVDTLTAEQRQFLSEWLLENYARNPAKVVSSPATAPDTSPQQAASNEATADTIEAEIDRRVAARLADNRASEKKPASDSSFEARLTGNFTGWSGKTVFRLDDGQVWRQRSAANYRHRGTDMRVKFKKNWMGGWEMTVVSSGKTVLVSKVK
ncbi:MAG: hypothetical protein CMN49_03620 [SAR116 cluster bacterium]|nr:hypothetical protein [SAR116 cluster bacterium]